MRYRTISEIYEANDLVRERFKETLAGLNEQQAATMPDGEKWSIAQVAEHVSMVGHGMYRICAKLLAKAEANGELHDGVVDLDTFADKMAEIAELKLEAPEFVRPTGTKSIAESVKLLDETHDAFRELRPLFEKYDARALKFPHPYLGDMTAVEWLAMSGGHEGRHLRQIKAIIAKLP
jgi:hypothetical protein